MVASSADSRLCWFFVVVFAPFFLVSSYELGAEIYTGSCDHEFMRFLISISALLVLSGCAGTMDGYSSFAQPLQFSQAPQSEPAPIRSGPCPGFTNNMEALEAVMAKEALMKLMP